MICNSVFAAPRIVFRWDWWNRWNSAGFGAAMWDRRVGPVEPAFAPAHAAEE